MNGPYENIPDPQLIALRQGIGLLLRLAGILIDPFEYTAIEEAKQALDTEIEVRQRMRPGPSATKDGRQV